MTIFYRQIKQCTAIMVCCLACLLTFSLPVSAAVPVAATDKNISDAAIEEALKRLLHEKPELVLDVLRNNSEVVLEVAQQGNILRKRKGMVAQWQEDAKVPKKIQLEGAFSRGNPKAPVTIVAYSDFTCSFCRQADAVLSQILAKYKNNVRFVFKPLPKEDATVSLLAACYTTAILQQDTEKGWAFYDALFANVDELEKEGETYLKQLVTKLGLDAKKISVEAANKKVADKLAQDRDEADKFGITGTPYFFVNDLMIRGAVPGDLFEEAIEMALKLKK